MFKIYTVGAIKKSTFLMAPAVYIIGSFLKNTIADTLKWSFWVAVWK